MFKQFRSAVAEALEEALTALDYPTDDLGLEEPPAEVDATLASSVAFRLAPTAEAPPPAVAQELAGRIQPQSVRYLDRVETKGPYINFHTDESYLLDTLQAARQPEYGQLEDNDTSVVVEHTSANPTGPIHVGRGRNPILGDAVANLLDYAGCDVERHYYVNDAGRQIALFTWAYETFEESELPEPEREKSDYDLVRYYRKGNQYLKTADNEETAAAEAEIEAIMQGLESGDEATLERVTAVVDTVLAGMRETLNRLPVHFDEFVKETRFMSDGTTDQVIDRLKQLDKAVYEDNAWQLDLEDYGIDKNFVFLRSDGTSLYTTRDIAHHEWKFDRFDRAVTVIGEDHRLTFQQLRQTLELLGRDTDQLDQLFYSYVNLPGGQGMSTREGTGIDLDELLDEAVKRARHEVEERIDDRIRGDDLTDADIERIARQVGIGAVRYDIVAKQPSKGITFEFERALDFEAQSAPYIQYVHARCCGVLEEATARGVMGDGGAFHADPGTFEAPEERALLRELARFPDVVETAADELEPHQIATYTRALAERFNAFYRECPVLDADSSRREARLELVSATKHTVANALDIIGVAAPDSM